MLPFMQYRMERIRQAFKTMPVMGGGAGVMPYKLPQLARWQLRQPFESPASLPDQSKTQVLNKRGGVEFTGWLGEALAYCIKRGGIITSYRNLPLYVERNSIVELDPNYPDKPEIPAIVAGITFVHGDMTRTDVTLNNSSIMELRWGGTPTYRGFRAPIIFDSCSFLNQFIRIKALQRIELRDCFFTLTYDNSTFDGVGFIEVEGDSASGVYALENKIQGCVINAAKQTTAPASVPYGIWLKGYSSDNKILGNEVGEVKYGSGIKLFYSSSNVLQGNTLWGNKYAGLSMDNAHHNTIVGNRIDHNLQQGLYMINCSDNTIVGNEIYMNSQEGAGVGYNLYIDSGCYSNLIAANKVKSVKAFTEQVAAPVYGIASNNNIAGFNVAGEDYTFKRRFVTLDGDGVSTEFTMSNPFGTTDPTTNVIFGTPASADAIAAKLLAVQIETTTNTGDTLRLIFQNAPAAGTGNVQVNLLRVWTAVLNL